MVGALDAEGAADVAGTLDGVEVTTGATLGTALGSTLAVGFGDAPASA